MTCMAMHISFIKYLYEGHTYLREQGEKKWGVKSQSVCVFKP